MSKDVPDSLLVIIERIQAQETDHGRRLAALVEHMHTLGVQEVPIGSNDGTWVRRFLRGDIGLAWCAAFLLRLMMWLDSPLPTIGYWSARSVRQWWAAARRAGEYLGPGVLPARGDIIVLKGHREGSGWHVGCVVAVDKSEGKWWIRYISGNDNHRVRAGGVWHGASNVRGFIRIRGGA